MGRHLRTPGNLLCFPFADCGLANVKVEMHWAGRPWAKDVGDTLQACDSAAVYSHGKQDEDV